MSLLFALLLATGCMGRRNRAYSIMPEAPGKGEAVSRARSALAHLYPAQYRATQRAILSIGRRQYVTEGVLEVSPERGHHLVVISTLGLVTEVQIDTNGVQRVLRVTPLFNENWSRKYVARDLRLLFTAPRDLPAQGQLADGRVVVSSSPAPDGRVTHYIFSPDGKRLEEVEIARGKRRFYHALVRHYREFPGFTNAMPAEFRVSARAYRLDLRTAEVRRPGEAVAGSASVAAP